MYESGYYPAGAENDPRAPWNQRDPEMLECEECHGTGFIFYAYNIDTDEETECTEATYNLLPDNEEEARAKRQHFIRGEKETCSCCDGTGEIEEEYDDEPDDRYDYYRDMQLERDYEERNR